MSLFSSQMNDHFRTASGVNNLEPVCQTKQSLVNNNTTRIFTPPPSVSLQNSNQRIWIVFDHVTTIFLKIIWSESRISCHNFLQHSIILLMLFIILLVLFIILLMLFIILLVLFIILLMLFIILLVLSMMLKVYMDFFNSHFCQLFFIFL